MSEQNNYFIEEEKPDHHFRTETPNIIFDLVDIGILSDREAWTYQVIKRIAGDSGASTYSKPELAKKCGFGETLFDKCLKKLENDIEIIGGPLIFVERGLKPDGSKKPLKIKIRNIWKKNGDFYRERKEFKEILGGSPNEPGVVRQTNQGGSPNEYKEEPLKKNKFKEEPTDNPTLHKNKEVGRSVLSEKNQMKEHLLKMRFKEKGNPCGEKFSEPEVDRLINKHTVYEICDAIEYIKNHKNRHAIQSEKGYFLTAIRKKYK